MQALEITTVEPYEAPHFKDVQFVHHYTWKGTTYKAGDYFMSLKDVNPKEDPDLHELWSDLDDYLQHAMKDILEESDKLEAKHETFRLQFRQHTEHMLKQIKANPKNPTPYYLLMRAKAMELRQKAHATVLIARSQVANYLKPAIIFVLQSKLRTNLPLFLAEMETSKGYRAAVAHVWNLPQMRDQPGAALKFNPDLCNPDCLRDFRDGLHGMLPPEEFKELCQKHGPKPKLIQKFTEADQRLLEGKKPKLIVPD